MASATTLDPALHARIRDVVPPSAIRQAAERLVAGASGILLVGSSVQTSAAVGDLLAYTRSTVGNKLQPVRFPAATGTPELLRDVVGRAYEARPDAATRLLIVVAQADTLSSETVKEFEIAAQAASVYGGLQFLFTSSDDLSRIWKRDELANLSASLKHPVHLVAETDEPGLLATYGTSDAPETLEDWPAEAPRRGIWRRIIVTGLAVLAVAALVVIGVGYQRHMPWLSQLSAQLAPAASVAPPPAREGSLPAPPVHADPAQAASGEPPAARPLPEPSRTEQVAVQHVVIPPVVAPRVQPAIRLNVTAPAAPFSAAPVAPIAVTEIAPPAPAAVIVPGASLLLIAEPGDTLPSLYEKVYRGMTPPPYSDVTAVNPATIKPGDHLMFPTPPNGWRP